MTRHKEDNAFTVQAELRSFKRPEPFVIKWEYPIMEVTKELDPNQLRAPGGRPKSYDLQQLVSCLGEDGLTAGEWEGRAKANHGMGTTTYYDLRKKALAEKRVEQRGKKFYRLPIVVSFNPVIDTHEESDQAEVA